MIRQNLHTHSVYCDGKDTIEEMAGEAVRKGFTILGFSGHGPCAVDDCAMSESGLEKYIRDVRAVREKYRDQIHIFLGIEEDMMQRIPSKDPYDYVIGSKHFIEVNGQVRSIDYSENVSREIVEMYNGDFLRFAQDYYEDVSRMAEFDEVDIIGHLDLLTKFNEDESFISFHDPAYLSFAEECIDILTGAGKILEVNTGAIARGYRRMPYPEKQLLSYIHEKGGKILLSSDCHDRMMLDCFYRESLELIRECGFTSMMYLTEDGFREAPLDEFR